MSTHLFDSLVELVKTGDHVQCFLPDAAALWGAERVMSDVLLDFEREKVVSGVVWRLHTDSVGDRLHPVCRSCTELRRAARSGTPEVELIAIASDLDPDATFGRPASPIIARAPTIDSE